MTSLFAWREVDPAALRAAAWIARCVGRGEVAPLGGALHRAGEASDGLVPLPQRTLAAMLGVRRSSGRG
jgi:hypothetical protein